MSQIYFINSSHFLHNTKDTFFSSKSVRHSKFVFQSCRKTKQMKYNKIEHTNIGAFEKK